MARKGYIIGDQQAMFPAVRSCSVNLNGGLQV
jgi:hypothetical protein